MLSQIAVNTQAFISPTVRCSAWTAIELLKA